MLGIGNIFTIANGACAELCDAQGAEVIDVCGRSPVALTVANGLKLLAPGLPSELNGVARSMTIKHLAQGAQHGLAVTSLGALYVWGDCSYGQLGLRQSTLEGGLAPQPVLHAHLERQTIARVAAGDHHSVAVTEDFGVYTWGRNSEGQCGTGPCSPQQLIGPGPGEDRIVFPRFVAALHKVKIRDAVAGARFTACLAVDGSVYTFGEGLAGQLGVGTVATCAAQPQLVAFDVRTALSDDPAATHVGRPRAGSDSGSSSGVGGGAAGAFATGHRHHGHHSHSHGHGHGTASIRTDIVQLSAGTAHVLARSSSGHVFAWGFNCKGQLGVGDTHSRHRPVIVRHASSHAGSAAETKGAPFLATCVSAGGFHSAAVCGASGSVFVWGAARVTPRAGADSREVFPASAANPWKLGGDASASSTAAAAKWRFPTGTGPLSPRSAGSRSPRSTRRQNSSPRPGQPDAGSDGDEGAHAPTDAATASEEAVSTTSEPVPQAPPSRRAAVEAGTWRMPAARTAAHARLRAKQREYGVMLQAAAAVSEGASNGASAGGAAAGGGAAGPVAKALAAVGLAPAISATPGKPTGALSTLDLQLLAAAAGTRLRDAPAVSGAPWERASVPRADPADGGDVLLSPTLLEAPFLAGGRRASAVACGQHCTTVFLPALLQAVDPAVTLDTGGRKLTLSGQALGSLCRLGRAYRDAADAGQLSATLAARNPNAELCALAQEAFADGTGMVPIPGLLVRFTVLPRQPGKRADDPPEFGDEDGEGGGGAEGADGGATAGASRDSSQVFYAKAYYPAGWRSDPAADVPGRANDALVAAAGGAFHTQQGAMGGRQLVAPPNLDSIVVVAPTVPRPCAVGISLIVKPPRPWVAGLSDAAAALPLPIGPAAAPLDLVLAAGPGSEQAAADAAAATGAGSSGGHGAAAGGGAPEQEEEAPSSAVSGIGAFDAQHPSTMRRRGQVVAGRVALNFVTLPVINQAAPAMLRLPEPAGATRGAVPGAGPRAVGGGRGVENGAAASHAAQAPIVTLSGEHLFGAALTDPAAGPVAESLIDLVKAAVQAREREEAYLLVSEVGLPAHAGLDADGAPSGSSLSLTRGASAAGTATPTVTEREGSAGSASIPQGQGEDERIDLLLPTLHLKRGFGGPDMPHGVLVRFAVYSAPALAPAPSASAASAAPVVASTARPGRGAAAASNAASITSSMPPPAAADPLAGAKLLGLSEPVRGWFTCAYDEHLVHVMHAVDRMTGTTQAATKAASNAGGPGSGGTTVLGSRFGGGSVMSAAASGLFGPSGGGASSRKDAEDEDEDEEDEDDGDDEGVVGRYSATVSCALPDLSAITGGSPRGSGSQSAGIPEAVESLYQQLLAGEIPIDALGMATGIDAPAGARSAAGGEGGAASAVAASFSFEEQFEAAVRARGGGSGALLLRPEVSVNGGRDFIAGAPQSVITAFSPVFSHVTPPCGPGAGGYALKIRGLGLVDAPNLQVRFTRLPGPDGAASGAAAGASVVARAAFVDSSTLSVMVPELPAPVPAAPLSPKVSAGSGSPRAAGSAAPTPAPAAVGHASFRVEVSTDGGATFSSGPHMQLVAHWGGDVHTSLAAPQSVILVPTGGQMLQLPLQARTMPCFDAWTQPVPQPEGAADAPALAGAANSTTWVPPLALVGHPIYGLGSHVVMRMWQGTLAASTAAADSAGPSLGTQRSLSSPSMADRANSFRSAASASSSTGPGISSVAASFRPPEGCKWHADSLPVHASTTQADCLRVALPPLGTLMPLAAPTVVEAPATSRQGSASTSHLPTWTPDSRQAVVEVAVWGSPLRTRLQLRYFDPNSLTITSVGPKKLALGGEISVSVEGLEALVAGRDGLKPVSASGAASPAAGAKGAAASKSAVAAVVAPAPDAEPPVLAPVPVSALHPRLRVTGGGLTITLSARIDGGSITAAVPSDPSMPVGDVAVEASIDAGRNFTPSVAAKIAKK